MMIPTAVNEKSQLNQAIYFAINKLKKYYNDILLTFVRLLRKGYQK